MALINGITLDSGITLPNAYIKIEIINMMNTRWCDISVNIYKDQAARDDELSPVASLVHRCIDDYYEYFNLNKLNELDVNVVSQSYEWLKTLDYYVGSQDINPEKE